MQINMDDTNRGLASLISVILLLTYSRVLHKYYNLAVFCKKTPKKALSTMLPARFVSLLFTFRHSLPICLPAKKGLGISTTPELVSATSK